MSEQSQQIHPSGPVNEEIDLREVFLSIWDKRFLILFLTLLGASLSAIYARFAPNVFESSVLLIPTETPKTDQLGAAAALLGGKKGGGVGDLDLYQSLLTSRTVIHQLLRTSIANESDTGKGRREPLCSILKLDSSKKIDYSFAVVGLSKAIDVEVLGTGTGGILQVTAKASTPWLAQQIADAVVALGQEELRKVRSERSGALLPRLESAAARAKDEWDATTQAIARYRDNNRSISLPTQQLQLDRLNMERVVMEQKYLMARKEVEQQLLEREKAVPPALVLDPAELPAVRTKPRRTIIVLLGAIISFGVSCLGVVAWKSLAKAPSK